MKRALLLPALLAAASCQPTTSTAQPGSTQAVSAQTQQLGAGSLNSSASSQLFLSPEQFQVGIRRRVTMATAEGQQVFVEQLHCDGQGNLCLKVELQGPDYQSLTLPSAELADQYELRQLYFVRYRDLHITDAAVFAASYTTVEAPQVQTVAGRVARSITATSIHGYGSFELLVDQATDMLLGWTHRDAAGSVIAEYLPLEVSYTPDLQMVVWATSDIPSQPYYGPADNALLGIAPNTAGYIPAGFVTVAKQILFTGSAVASRANMHVELLTDGLQYLFVAQQRSHVGSTGGQTGLDLKSGGDFVAATASTVGPITVIEASDTARRVFVVGPAIQDELLAVLGSVFD